MKARSLVIAFVAALTLVAGAFVMPVSASGSDNVPNLSGTWKLDAAHSDSPQMLGGPGRGGPPEGGGDGRYGRGAGGPGGHRDGAGGPGAHRGPDGAGGPEARSGAGGPGSRDGAGGPASGGRTARGPMRGMMVPDRFAVVQIADGIELRDSLGVAVQRILIQPQTGLAPVDSAGVAQLAGAWKGEKLEAQTEGPRGGILEMTYELTDNGKTLKIATHVQPRGDRPAFDFTRVYERVSG